MPKAKPHSKRISDSEAARLFEDEKALLLVSVVPEPSPAPEPGLR
ncbi:MAG TPA: hypothetical protein VFH95_00370 [Candidatus Kapabacteria bacterium]|nr:hypothetical protein [Candidatus Kapabacteria bacterium]